MEHKVIADETTGEIRCSECGQSAKPLPYTGNILRLVEFTEAVDRFTDRHAKAHGWAA